MVTPASSRLSRWHLADAFARENINNNQTGWQDAIQTAAKMAALRLAPHLTKIYHAQSDKRPLNIDLLPFRVQLLFRVRVPNKP